MSENYAALYVKRAFREVPDFERACKILKLDANDPAQYPAIVKALCAIGQFGTIRLARKFPFVTNEEEFRLTALVGLRFYWVVLDFWDEEREKEKETSASRSRPLAKKPSTAA